MLPSTPPDSGPTLALIEASLTAISVAAAFAWPRLGSACFARIERPFARLARKQGLSICVAGFAALLLRLAILPVIPIPLPFAADDFSFLLAANTFLHGRLANPTPAMWTHFETIHVTMWPTYQSMYFPAQGLLLAAGKLLFGNPWFGILLSSALMCAAICWMLQAWLPPAWALLGGLLSVLHLALFSYWVNTYHAAGCISALGGALVLGAMPRLIKTARFRYGMSMAVGIVLLAGTRPYEGLLLCLPVAFVLGRWMLFGKNRPSAVLLLRRSAAPLALVIAAAAWMGYYAYRAFGNPLTLPYSVDRAQYAIAPYYVWQSPRPEPAYRHEEMRHFYHEDEADYYFKIHKRSMFLPLTLGKASGGLQFFAGTALLIPIIMARRVFLDRRIRLLLVCVLVLAAGLSIEIYMLPHYLAPFTVAFYAIGLQAMRHLRLWRPEGRRAGLAMVRLSVALCCLMAGLRLCAAPLNLLPAEWPPYHWNFPWYGPAHYGTDRARIEAQLQQLPGKELVIVRYTPEHNPLDEWVYNAADIDGSKVVWAREMDAVDNLELFHYYPDRKVWLAEPDAQPASVSPYPVPQQLTAASH